MAGLWFTRAMRGIALVLFVVLGLLTIVSLLGVFTPIVGVQMPFYTSDDLFTAALASGILYQLCRLREERAQ